MPLKSIGNKLNEIVQASQSFVFEQQDPENLIDATCPPLARIVSGITESKSKNLPMGKRLKIFQNITTSDEEENTLETEKTNDNWELKQV